MVLDAVWKITDLGEIGLNADEVGDYLRSMDVGETEQILEEISDDLGDTEGIRMKMTLYM
jgi:hypothetical protein